MKPDDGWTDDFLDGMRERGDPLADETVKDIFKEGRVDEVNRLLREMGRRDDIPEGFSEEVEEFLEKSAVPPPWRDKQKIERGEGLFFDYGLVSVVALWFASLPECFVLEREAKVLCLTKQLKEHPERRIRETARMIFPVMSRGGLSGQGMGIRQIQKVRLIHGAIRHLVLHPTPLSRSDSDPSQQTFGHGLLATSWDPKDEVPVSQEHLGYTLLTFGYVFVRSMRILGMGWSPEDEVAYLHCWNVAGHHLGVERGMMAETMEEAEELFQRIQDRGAKETTEGRDLTTALTSVIAKAIPWKIAKPIAYLMPRKLLGRDVADKLAIPSRHPLGARLLFSGLLASMWIVDGLLKLMRSRSHLARFLFNGLGRRFIKHMLVDEAFKGPPLRIPSVLVTRFRLPKEVTDRRAGPERRKADRRSASDRRQRTDRRAA